MTSPTLPTFATRPPRRRYVRNTARHNQHRRLRRTQRLWDLGLFAYSCVLIIALVLLALH